MAKKRFGYTTKLIVIVSVVLMIIYILTGHFILTNSKASLKSNIQERMLDVAKTAAANLNGDALKRITKDDRNSADYQNILLELVLYQENIDLKYIYCITQKGENHFVFNVDPSEPDDFGMDVVWTPALQKASQGIPSADDEPYEDSWGRFYSAYCPIYDSYGEMAGIVAVDFEAKWFDDQMDNLKFSMLSNGMLSLIVGALIVSIITGRNYKKLRDVNNDLALLGKDIESLTEQLSVSEEREFPSEGMILAERDESNDEVLKLGERIHFMRKEVEGYIDQKSAQANNMIHALAKDYRSVYYVNLDEDDGICYRSHTYIKQEESLIEGEHFKYREIFEKYAKIYVAEEYRDEFLNFIKPENIRKALKEEPLITLLYIAKHDGKESYEKLKIASTLRQKPVEDEEINVISVGIVDVNIETKKALEQNQALIDALAAAEEANKAKTSFLSNMSHEIRTPMNAIISIDSIALAEPDISDKTRDYLSKIGISAKHLLRIINDILDMSRIEAGRMSIKSERFLMSELIEQINTIVDSQCTDRGLKYVNHLDERLTGYYIGDALKLKQVLINILGNAVKYTEEKGTVTLTVEKVIGFADKTTMRFIIQDTGVGMDPEFVPKVFDAFSQEDASASSKISSTGLGMAITKGIVEMMNGRIEVESEKNVGSTFIVTLTFLDSDEEGDGREKVTTSDLTVLVVSDNVVSSSYVTIELGEAGISVDVATSCDDAVEKVRLHEARNMSYNMVIVDREMVSGEYLEVISSVKKETTADDMVIVLMGYHFRDIADIARDAGVNVFLSKPITHQNLMDKYTQTINSNTAEKKEIDFAGRHILLAEDKEINAEIMTMVLQMKDAIADVAENGKIAVEKFAEKEEGYYDAILMDMRMPEMDGITATETIRAMDRPDAKTIPIIALTANAFDEDVERSLQAGLNAHLTKPVEPDLLFDTLRRLIKE